MRGPALTSDVISCHLPRYDVDGPCSMWFTCSLTVDIVIQFYGMSSHKMKKYRWYTFAFEPGSFVDGDYADLLQESADKWAHSHVQIPDDVRDNALRFLAEQVNSRAEYDWSGLVDLETGMVMIPMVDFRDMDSMSRYTLTKNGLMVHPDESAAIVDDAGMNLTRDQLYEYIRTRIGEWVHIGLLYSGGGIADPMFVASHRGSEGSHHVASQDA